jgi:hypothetical protein
MEVYDLYDNATQSRWRYPGLLIDLISSFDRYPDEVVASILRRPEKALRIWDGITQRKRFFGIGTPDAHQNLKILGRQVDSYARALRFVNLHLLARSLNREEILSAFREGRGYTSFDLLADPTGFSLIVEGEDPDSVLCRMGEELRFEPELTLKATAPLTARMTLFRNGAVLQEEIAQELTHQVRVPGVYRVECELRLVGRFWPWIISNPVYLRGGDAIL